MFRSEGPSKEEREEIARQRRMQAHEERRQRILDPKKRNLGVDVTALQEQIAEKRRLQEEEKERDRLYDEQRLLQDQQAQFLERTCREQRRAALQEDDEFRLAAQRSEQRREYDLNRPDHLKVDRPAREGDQDSRLGPSSLQVFEGEDLSEQERRLLQKKQLESFVAQQLAEKEEARRREEEEEHVFQERQEEMNFLAQEAENTVQAARRELDQAVRDHNLASAYEKRQRERTLKEQELQDNEEEIRNQLQGHLLNETLESTISAVDPHRFRPDHFKGLRPDQHRVIDYEQKRGMTEAQMARLREKEEERAWAQMQEYNRQQALRMEREVQRRRAAEAQQLAQENSKFAQDRKQRYDVLYNQVYKNEVTEDFFNKFGASCR